MNLETVIYRVQKPSWSPRLLADIHLLSCGHTTWPPLSHWHVERLPERAPRFTGLGTSFIVVVDKPAFAGEVRQWLSVELTDQDIVDIYGGGKNPGFPPSCVVYHAMKYINGNP